MSGNNSMQRIIRRWTPDGAPTGEGTCYLTESGDIWQSVLWHGASATGEHNGWILGGMIYPAQGEDAR